MSRMQSRTSATFRPSDSGMPVGVVVPSMATFRSGAGGWFRPGAGPRGGRTGIVVPSARFRGPRRPGGQAGSGASGYAAALAGEADAALLGRGTDTAVLRGLRRVGLDPAAPDVVLRHGADE